MKTTFLAWAALLVAFTAPANAWHLSQCTSTDLGKRGSFGARLRAAQPASSAYVPRPYPATPAEMSEDFFYQYNYLRHLPGAEAMKPLRRAIDDAADREQLDLSVITVENWRGERCLSSREGDHMFLLRLVDRAKRREVGRVWLEENGLLGAIAYREPDAGAAWWNIPVQPLGDAAARVRALVHADVAEAQYVTAAGSLRCDVILPCIAMRSPATGTIYVVDFRGGIYSLPRTPRLFRPRHDMDRLQQNRDFNRTLLPGEAVMSIGRDEFAVVRRMN